MKLGPVEIRRARAAAADIALPHGESVEFGATGTLNQHGFLHSDEYNRDLVWPKSLETWERMLDGDDAAREAYGHCAAPLWNANWGVDPAGNTPEDLQAAELVRAAYMDWLGNDTPDGSGFAHLMQLTTRYLPQGYQVFERVPKLVENVQLVYTDPSTSDDVNVPARNYLVWDKWAHRKPRTIWKWNVDNGRLLSVLQIAFKTGADGQSDWGEWTIDADRLSVFVNEKQGDDFRGTSIFRSAYKAWYLKELVEKVAGISVERHGVGINTMYLGEDFKSDQAMVDRVEEMMADLSAGERPYLVFPGPKMPTTSHSGGPQQGFLFEINTPDGGLPDFTPFLEYLRGGIKGAVLARFSELGHGSMGARATGDTQSEPWYDSLHAVADYISGVHAPAIRQLVQQNIPRLDRFPSLVARDIETRSLGDWADAVAKLTVAGQIRPDKTAREASRRMADIGDEDLDDDTLDPDHDGDVDIPGSPLDTDKDAGKLQQIEEEN